MRSAARIRLQEHCGVGLRQPKKALRHKGTTTRFACCSEKGGCLPISVTAATLAAARLTTAVGPSRRGGQYKKSESLRNWRSACCDSNWDWRACGRSRSSIRRSICSRSFLFPFPFFPAALPPPLQVRRAELTSKKTPDVPVPVSARFEHLLSLSLARSCSSSILPPNASGIDGQSVDLCS